MHALILFAVEMTLDVPVWEAVQKNNSQWWRVLAVAITVSFFSGLGIGCTTKPDRKEP
ncbi:MAG TPA: hypothetical protein VMS08_00205 [Candidatus Saccharimonadia bacterium]|nr:hypothetical protein [Candidatus Saccharimonadia bacterium]